MHTYLTKTLSFITLLITLFISPGGFSDVITKVEFQQGTSINNVYLRLFDNIAPLTVQNFLDYANGTKAGGGQYDNSFIHRSVPDFVIQGGGFLFDPSTGVFDVVLEGAPVSSEYSVSNTRGTIAMGLIGADENSATNQWFINLNDNSSVLDAGNSVGNPSFTVFGSVIGNGMAVADEIASRKIFNNSGVHPAFIEMPLVDYVSGLIVKENLVSINNVVERLTISPDIDFGTVLTNAVLTSDIVIQNTAVSDIEIGNIGNIDAVTVPFSIVNDTCTANILVPTGQCVVTVKFAPQNANAFDNTLIDTLNIEIISLIETADVPLDFLFSVKGTVESIEPSIATSVSELDFGEVKLFDPTNGDLGVQFNIGVINHGLTNLNVSSVVITGADVSDFELKDNCVVNSPLMKTDTCFVNLIFKPLSTGAKTVTLIINSDDPNSPVISIPIAGTSVLDGDGVIEALENSAPNGGDGNNDSILDSLQGNVATLPDLNGNYISYILSSNDSFKDVRIVNQNVFNENQDAAVLSAGVHEFTINNIQPDEVVEVGIFLPANINPLAYYIYSSTLDNLSPHWHQFVFDGETGASFLGVKDVLPISAENSVIKRNLVVLKIKNGGRGDSSNIQDSKLIIRGGLDYNTASNSGGGGALSSFFLQLIIVMLVFFRSTLHWFKSSIASIIKI